jgi:catechol 2,3-dioxygenase-like lactoylglutathione lyase family enzyme
MIKGISHINLSVSNLEVSWIFYKDILGFKPLAKWPEGAYFLAGDTWFCINLDVSTRTHPLPEYTHMAFSVEQADFDSIARKIKQSGTKIWKENSSPGDSLYFLDPDGHKLELHSSNWQTRIETAKQEQWEGMTFFV